MFPSKEILNVLKILEENFPVCFRKKFNRVPLVSRIHEEARQYYAEDLRIARAQLRRAINFYIAEIDYLKNVIYGAPKLNLDGKIKAKVTRYEATKAKKRLEKRG